MKIIIAPTKKQNTEGVAPTTTPLFMKQSNELRAIVKNLKPNEIIERFKVSSKIAEQILSYYHDQFDSQAAISLYSGAVFKSASVDQWNEEDLKFAQEHVWILSALYGFLRPLDGITPYRLDFFSKIDLDLYNYWDQEASNLTSTLSEPVINLASKEFSKMLPQDLLIDIVFLEENGKTQATRAKQARGDMLNFIIINKITSPEQLQNYSRLGYRFNQSESSETRLVFDKK